MDLVLRSAAILLASSAKYDFPNSRRSAASQPGSVRCPRRAVTASDCGGGSGRATLLAPSLVAVAEAPSLVAVAEVDGCSSSRGRLRNRIIDIAPARFCA